MDIERASPVQAANDPSKALNSTSYMQLPHMCLIVVFEKYWLAILHKEKLIEFR